MLPFLLLMLYLLLGFYFFADHIVLNEVNKWSSEAPGGYHLCAVDEWFVKSFLCQTHLQLKLMLHCCCWVGVVTIRSKTKM